MSISTRKMNVTLWLDFLTLAEMHYKQWLCMDNDKKWAFQQTNSAYWLSPQISQPPLVNASESFTATSHSTVQIELFCLWAAVVSLSHVQQTHTYTAQPLAFKSDVGFCGCGTIVALYCVCYRAVSVAWTLLAIKNALLGQFKMQKLSPLPSTG